MADQKVSALDPITGAALADTDVFPVVDTSAAETKKIGAVELRTYLLAALYPAKGIEYAFSTTTTDADPGSGILRFNNATPASVTAIYIDNLNSDGEDVSALLDALATSTSTIKSTLVLTQLDDATKWVAYSITAIADSTGYRTLTVTHVDSGALPDNAGAVGVYITLKGDKGDTGTTGDTGDTGTTGSAGADGLTVLNGAGVPSGGTGADGDFYIDTSADTIYGPKASGAWGSATSLVGPAGAGLAAVLDDITPQLGGDLDPNGNGIAFTGATVTDITGADTLLVSGTAGTAGNVAMWNVDGDLVDGSQVAANIIVDGDIGTSVQAYDVDTAKTDVAQTFTKAQGITPVALTDGASIATDASLSNVFTVTLAGSRTLANPTNLVAGKVYTWIITQDATGSRALGYGSYFEWFGGGTEPTLSTAASSVDMITGIATSTTKIICNSALDAQ